MGGNPQFKNDEQKWKSSILSNLVIVKIDRDYKETDIIGDPVLRSNFELLYQELQQNKAKRFGQDIEAYKEKIEKIDKFPFARKLTYLIKNEKLVSLKRSIAQETGILTSKYFDGVKSKTLNVKYSDKYFLNYTIHYFDPKLFDTDQKKKQKMNFKQILIFVQYF